MVMAQANEREPRLNPETRDSHGQRRDIRTHDEMPDNRRPQYFRGKTYRKRKVKTPKPTSRKTFKETDKEIEEDSSGERSPHISNEEVIHEPREAKVDPCNGIKEDSIVVDPSPIPAKHSATAKPKKNSKEDKTEKVHSEKHQEDLSEAMSNCSLHDPDALFNALSVDEKLLICTNYIEVPKKIPEKNPNAKFFCNICKFYLTSIPHCKLHLKAPFHSAELKERKVIESMKRVPAPTHAHIEALDKMVVDAVEKYGMVESEREVAVEVAEEVGTFVSENFPGCSLMLYGSVASRLALKESNIDMNLRAPPNLNGPTTLGAISKLISENPLFSDVTKDFDEGRPSIHFVHKRTNVKCSVCLCKDETIKTTEIISKYQTIDPRVRQLAVVFRKWAKLCKIDNHKNGMWPPHTFPILLIYYLQQCNPPVLPVLHELIGDPEDDAYLDPSELSSVWKQLNSKSVGELWLGLLRFYALDYLHSDRVVCIRKKAPLKRLVKNWIGKRTAIEDPSSVKRNVARTIVHNNSFRYIMNCFRLSYLYFAIPRCEGKALYGSIQTPQPKLDNSIEYRKRMMKISQYWRAKLKCNPLFSFDSSSSEKEVSKKKHKIDTSENASEELDKELCPENPCDTYYIIGEELSESDANFFSSRLKKEFISFDFKAETGNKLPPIVCTICTMDGHSKSACPDAHLPPLPNLPSMTEEFQARLDSFCHSVYEISCQKSEDIECRKRILSELEDYIRGFYPDVQLSLFGSSANGFGFRNSDLDICLTFKSNPSGKGIDVTKLINKLVTKLKKMPSIRNIVPIPSAKVPIIKFKHIYTQLEGDISLYNTLAQHNTQLLKMYSCIDERVKVLGFVMKKFAKLCNICDASRGSLSSYAYILMVIYFLQQCDPPVLPVLQELTEVQPKPEEIEEGQDVWFFKDRDKLPQIWPEYGKNKLTVGTLWLKMLRFYTEDFDFEEYVISIRQKQKLFKFEKMWYKKAMAIEDPFDITHNLGGALSRKMKQFIIKSLRKGRLHFGSPRSKLPSGARSWEEHFFNIPSLRDCAPPNNGCHICKKIGHKVRNCPERVNFQREKRQAEVDHGKNAPPPVGTNQHQDQRRRIQPAFANSQYWARGTTLIKDDTMHIPAFTHQQIRPGINQPYQCYQQHWVPYPRPGPPPMNWYPVVPVPPNNRTPEMPSPRMKMIALPLQKSTMPKVDAQMEPRNHMYRSVDMQGQTIPPNNRTPEMPPTQMKMIALPLQKSTMPKVDAQMEPRNHMYRSVDMQGQAFHDARTPLSNYRKQVNGEERPADPQGNVTGAIPKVPQMYNPRQRQGKVKGAKK